MSGFSDSPVVYRYSQQPFELAPLVRLFRQYNAFIGIDLAFQDFDAEMATLPGKYAASHGGELYIAQCGETPVGCVAYYRFDEGIAELKRLFVVPQAQGMGLGKKLLQQAMADAAVAGYHTLYLDSVARLTAARKLYDAMGFTEIENYNNHPYPDAYHMARTLKDVVPADVT